MLLTLTIEIETGKWMAAGLRRCPKIPGALVYGSSTDEAITKVQALTLRVLAERLETR